ncbi:MAG: hydroxymethylbilane synthase [Planctomycetota bacterium]
MAAIRVGTRGSPLAIWQSEQVENHLRERGHDVDRIVLKTRAENFPDRPLTNLGVGIFTKELDDALLRGDIDLAVHSAKDIPSTLPEGLSFAAALERESPFDALISADGSSRLADLPQGARIGTGSPRRRAQLLAFRDDFDVVPLRGNVDTRLRKIETESLAGTILSHAGLIRLGRTEVISEVLNAEAMIPAPGQGIVVVACREDDASARENLAALDHGDTRCALDAERAFLRELQGGCQIPAGCFAKLDGGEQLEVRGILSTPDGVTMYRESATGPIDERVDVGRAIARRILDAGGTKLLGR